MAAGLFPVIQIPDINIKGQYDQRYKPSYHWDMEKQDFVRDGANRVTECNGFEAFKVWCVKAVSTERKCCLAYPNEIGSEMVRAFSKPSRRAQELSIERTIRETLMTNPRTEYVRDFSFSWDSDKVEVSFTVKGINYDSFRLEL